MSPRSTLRIVTKRLLGGPLQVSEPDIVFDALSATRGTMIDVGAHYGSSQEPFADAGWIVHAFEPDPSNRQHLVRKFADRSNVTIIPQGVSDQSGSLPFYTSAESTGVSSLAPFTPKHELTSTVEVTTLGAYTLSAGVRSIDFLKVDVEGFERKVLRGMDWDVKPTVIVLEFEDSKTVPLGYTWTDLADELVDRGYQVIVSEWAPITAYGADHTWIRFADYPTSLSDERAWGNLIAVRGDRSKIDVALRRAKRRNALHVLRSKLRR